ncbi:MAG: ATP-binding cassette domain-containing protein [Desulfobacterales bacterium]
MIEVKDLCKSFKNITALGGVTFSARDGEITGLLGPNGAGKTTALRIVDTAMKPDSGTARVDGFDTVQSPRDVQKRLGILPETRGIYPRLTTRENIEYFGRLQGLDEVALQEHIEQLVDVLDMQKIVDRRTEGFSSGERLKVAIARALIHHPQNVLLDEPTSGLDVMSTRAIRSLIRRFRDEGKCIVLSTHIMQEISALCDHIVVISNGQVVASGTPDELRRTTGQSNLEDAFVSAIGTEEGLML